MAGLSQLLNPGWYQLSYDELSPEVRSLIDSGAFRWGSTTSGGDDPKTMQGWQVQDYSQIPTLPDGTYFDNSNRDFNVHAGSWTDAGSWDNIIDPSRVTDDPNYGRVTTNDNAYDNKGIGDFMEKVVIGTLLGGAGLAAAGAAGFAVPSWVTGAGGAAEGAGALSAADAYAIASGGQAATPFVSAVGGLDAGAMFDAGGLFDPSLSSQFPQGIGPADPESLIMAGGQEFDGLAGTALDNSINAGGLLDAPLSAADAYAIASGGQTPTPFTSAAGVSLSDAAKLVQKGAGLLGGGDPAAPAGGGAGGGLLGGGGSMGGGGDAYFMGLLRKYYGLA